MLVGAETAGSPSSWGLARASSPSLHLVSGPCHADSPWVSVGSSDCLRDHGGLQHECSSKHVKATLPFLYDLASEVSSIISIQACPSKGRNRRPSIPFKKNMWGRRCCKYLLVHLAIVTQIPPMCIINTFS